MYLVSISASQQRPPAVNHRFDFTVGGPPLEIPKSYPVADA
jgi:hypothetical protein